eukprot:CAMPEP_0119357880 /NCGR_PEP_ID=MMETSP1334-20130426/6186_1 /TAXON_ID=127549 /ORGANISM="Calcidiscus leptoporus, Strain RCC1130" /LENGTH=352 /DNA_ID=CAMNT_0007372231 /DNA_START=203 /DNA_END=1257 /DNA_ORIENTATION=-
MPPSLIFFGRSSSLLNAKSGHGDAGERLLVRRERLRARTGCPWRLPLEAGEVRRRNDHRRVEGDLPDRRGRATLVRGDTEGLHFLARVVLDRRLVHWQRELDGVHALDEDRRRQEIRVGFGDEHVRAVLEARQRDSAAVVLEEEGRRLTDGFCHHARLHLKEHDRIGGREVADDVRDARVDEARDEHLPLQQSHLGIHLVAGGDDALLVALDEELMEEALGDHQGLAVGVDGHLAALLIGRRLDHLLADDHERGHRVRIRSEHPRLLHHRERQHVGRAGAAALRLDRDLLGADGEEELPALRVQRAPALLEDQVWFRRELVEMRAPRDLAHADRGSLLSGRHGKESSEFDDG